ncbi:MAG: putative 2,4-dienoyl-CoA reductase [Bacteroidetes bacterium ADurb.Bin302]|nr:MAG: putative 2,4-dienoyl-CoA reductase [Bacteroidetes bacterium ADurb.Bin302]
MEEKKKFILVTGASSGIGRRISIGLSSTYNIILNGRNLERLIETKEKCSIYTEQLIFPSDLSNINGLEEELSSFIKEHNIEIQKFVHCAGFMKMVPLKMVNIETINTTFATNIFSAALIIKVLTNRKLNNAALTTVVLISSNISNFGAKAFSIYGASKAGLDGLMRSLAVELAPKVRINSVLPGAVKTEMTESIYEDEETVKRMEATYPLGLGETSDIFEIVDFLLSEKARWITGQQITVDGGRTINITG